MDRRPDADLRRLRLLRDAERIAGIGSWEWDPATGRVTWSEALYRIFGVGPGAEIDLDRYASLLHPDDRDRVLDRVDEVRRTGDPAHFEHRVLRPDGELRWVACRAESVGDDGSGDVRVVGTARDVTAERRAAETAEAYDRERRARAEAEAAAERLRFLNEVGRALSSSAEGENAAEVVARIAVPAFADWCMVDVVEEDGAVRTRAAVHRDADRQRLLRRFCRERASDAPLWLEPAARALKDGEGVFLPELGDGAVGDHVQEDEGAALVRELGFRSLVAVPLGVRGRVLGVLTFVVGGRQRGYRDVDFELARDVGGRTAFAIRDARLYREAREARAAAERKAAEEEALRRAAEALGRSETVEEVTARIVASAVRATSADGAVLERLVPETPALETVAGSGAFTLPIGVRIPVRGSLASEVLERGEPLVLERLAEADYGVSEDLRRACGDCAAIAVPLSSGGEDLGALFLLRGSDQPTFEPEDAGRARTFGELSAIALRKARTLEREEQRNRTLERVMESRSRLMQAFTHDVKNPLGAAESHARLLLEEVRGSLTDGQRDSAERIVGSIDSALGLIGDVLELSRAESGSIRIERERVDLGELAADVVREHTAEAEDRNLRLALGSTDDLPEVETDRARVRQILANLLSNAVKYTETGGVEVRAERRSGGREDSGWAALVVSDTGPGIPEEAQELLFREFSRIGSPDEPGTGLGLAISRRIARLLGGDITVESDPGEGSTFTLWIPLDPGAASGAAGPHRTPAAS